jgi:mannose-1-phosphate guanylyltransferase
MLLMLTRTHERFYADQIRSLSTGPILVQPYNHGTAPAIAYAVTLLGSMAPNAIVGFFPSDHHFENDDAIAASVRRAYLHARRDHQRVVLLGIVPKSAENAYGWIEPGQLMKGVGGTRVFEVRRFWEKPSKENAQRLLAARCLWNSFIMIGHVNAFLNILRASLPDLLAAFEEMWAGVTPGEEEAALRELFSKFPTSNFSDAVLSACPSRLAALAVDGTGWTDLGDPERAQSIFRLEQLR